MATNAAELQAQASRLRDEAVALAGESQKLRESGQFEQARAIIRQAQQKLDQADALSKQANLSENSPGTASTGEVVAEQQQARDDNATAQNPPTPFVQSSTGLNVLPEDELETGTDGRIRPLSETQATPPAPPQQLDLIGESYAVPGVISNQAGVGAPRDDGTPKNSLSVQQTINANFSQRIDPRPNILDEYASYTYSLTWYVLTPEQYNQMQKQAKKNISSWQILVQSGGAPTAPGNGAPGRNEFFSNDYYLDNLVVDTSIAGKGTGTAANATTLEFSITEPNGFTLIENLYRAVSTIYKRNNIKGVYTSAQYCLCIRFYGYNEFGELIQVGRATNPGGGGPGVAVTTDNRAVVEKFIPFTITDVTTRIVSRAVEYQIKGAAIGTSTALSSQRGTIPYQYELAGSSVGELLNGRPVGTKYSRTDGRVSTDSPPSNSPTSPVNPGNQAGVNELGNFTGTTENPFTVVGA